MPSLWLMHPSHAVYAVACPLLEAVPPRLDLVDANPMRLHCDDPTFCPDFLDMGYRLVSTRLREVLRLDAGQARFDPVDTSACPAPMQQVGYWTVTPSHVADPLDHDRSTGSWQDVYDGPMEDWSPDAPTVRRWMLDAPNPAKPMRIRWREDFAPPAPLFQAKHPPWLLATDELVARVRDAGIADVAFQDPTIDYAPEPYLLLDEAGDPVGPHHPLWNPLVNTPDVLERFERERAATETC